MLVLLSENCKAQLLEYVGAGRFGGEAESARLTKFSMGNEEKNIGMSGSRSKDVLARDANGWQPIETAPKDGTRILLYRSGRAVCGNWDEDKYSRKPRPYWSHDLQHVFTLKDARANQPTHWMPLPDPPVV